MRSEMFIAGFTDTEHSVSLTMTGEEADTLAQVLESLPDPTGILDRVIDSLGNPHSDDDN